MSASLPHPTRQRLLYSLVAAIVILVIGAASLGYMRSKNDRSVPVKSLKSAQQADAALGFPLSSTGKAPAFDPRFIHLSAFDRAAIPVTTRMSLPMGSEHGALTYNAQTYWSDNKRRGGHHTGDDLNGIGGMNTDLGDPVYAISKGLVVYRGEPSPGWGKTIILAHRNMDGKILLSMYAHLDKSYAPIGKFISHGEPIGTVGTANLNYPAHLHLEIRDSPSVHIGHGYTRHPGNYVDPIKTIHSLQNKDLNYLPPCPLAILLRERIEERKLNFFSKKSK